MPQHRSRDCFADALHTERLRKEASYSALLANVRWNIFAGGEDDRCRWEAITNLSDKPITAASGHCPVDEDRTYAVRMSLSGVPCEHGVRQCLVQNPLGVVTG